MLARFRLTPAAGSVRRAGRATSAFLESDRRDLPEADERIGDIPLTGNQPSGDGQVDRGAGALRPTLPMQLINSVGAGLGPGFGEERGVEAIASRVTPNLFMY